ncbi:hypothetical protein K3495_g6120 [Podosphaera aphanis]|nr:hypothetical protein K3495_g6120 [Podosphaera aphanis]
MSLFATTRREMNQKNRILSCVHSGRPTDQPRSRFTTSLSENSPIRLQISKAPEAENMRSLIIPNQYHNHEAAENIAAYPAARALLDSEVEVVNNLSSIGAKPRIVIDALRKHNPNNLSTAQDICNVKKSQKRKIMVVRLETEPLLDILIERNVPHAFQRSRTGNLNGLFISPKTTDNIVRRLSANRAFLMDSTYKTKQYRMPMLHGIGVTATDETLTRFHCFMHSEAEEFYTWAMEELKKYLVARHVDCPNVVFVTDRELALMNALSVVFSGSFPMICS